MAHVRQSIRDNVVTAVTGLSTTGSVNYTIQDVIDDGAGITTLMFEADYLLSLSKTYTLMAQKVIRVPRFPNGMRAPITLATGSLGRNLQNIKIKLVLVYPIN